MPEQKNPFPRKSVVTLDGATGVALHTLVTPQIERAKSYALDYLDDGLGQVITVSGPYGSGKSHLVNFAVNAVKEAAPRIEARSVQIYQKALSADFISLYKGLIEQIGYPLLKELNDRFLSVIASREVTGESEEKKKNALLQLLPEEKRTEVAAQYQESSEKLIERLRVDPTIVYKYLDSLILQPEIVYDQRASELQLIAGENFKKAFFYLPDANLGPTAYKWFTMDQLTDTEVERLGVSSRLRTADDAKFALFLLVTLFHHANFRLLIYLDQIEKLLLGSDDNTLDKNRGVLFALAEVCPRENVFLALIGADDGWQLMREDFWSRVGATQIKLGQIPAEFGRALLDVYLNEKESCKLSPASKDLDILPFTISAADEMLRISKGNIRVFLQACHDVFKMHGNTRSGTIEASQVKQAIAYEVDEGSVAAEIQTILKAHGVPFELRNPADLNFKVDLVIGELTQPLAVIEIVNSLFYVDEADNALTIANHRKDLSAHYPTTRLIVVSVGYASAEVEERLEQIVDDYLVYEPQSFPEKFGTLLETLSANLATATVEEAVVRSDAQEALQVLLAAREKEIFDLNQRLRALSEQHTEAMPRQKEWRAWLRADQDKWEKRIEELESKANEDRTRQQEDGEKSRRRKLIVGTIAYFFSSILITVVLISVMVAINPFFPNRSIVPVFLFCLAIFLAAYYWLIYLRLSPLGLKTSEIANYKGDLSQLVLRSRTSVVSKSTAYRCLKNANPVIRYFGALVFLSDNHGSSASSQPTAEPKLKKVNFRRFWSRLAAIEGWKPLYLAYLKMSFREESLESTQRLFDLLLEANADDPRILYLLSTLPEQQRGQLGFRLDSLNTASHAYAKVFAHAVFESAIRRQTEWWGIPATNEALAQFSLAFSGMTARSRMQSLNNWFGEHGQFWHSGLEGTITLDLAEEDLRGFLETLSPHRESGLASFRDLPNSTFYLRLYRFFSEIQWRVDQGDVILKH